MTNNLRKGLDVSKYADPQFESDQMSQILKGLEDGLDVSSYCKKNTGGGKWKENGWNY